LRYSFSKVRKAKTYIPEKYQALPPWLQVKQRDPFEYKLRSFDEIVKEQEERPPEFPIEVIYSKYPKAEFEHADKSRKAKIGLNMLQMDLTKTQKERLIQLIGPRYKGSDKFYLISESYPTFEENIQKVLEMAREIYWEAKRAP